MKKLNIEYIKIKKEDLEKLLNIADTYLTCYCETYDRYILDEEEIKLLEDEEEIEIQKDLRETENFLNKINDIIKKENKK